MAVSHPVCSSGFNETQEKYQWKLRLLRRCEKEENFTRDDTFPLHSLAAHRPRGRMADFSGKIH